MPENDRLSGCLDEISLAFVEREATPKLLIKLSIQLNAKCRSAGEQYGRTRTIMTAGILYIPD
jgi:hypothetical protein